MSESMRAPPLITSILIIDDEDEFRELLRQMREQAGNGVIEARHGREGLQHYRVTPTDLAITDIFMPEDERLEKIRALRHEFLQVKVIAITGVGQRGSFDVLRVAKQLGAPQTLRKPFGLQDLCETVQDFLGAS
jgi:CheY-like chemotaxis protein